jgi:hypothetical protein
MRKQGGYVLAEKFPVEIKQIISNVINENYKSDVDRAILKANQILETAKTAKQFEHDQEIEKSMEDR